MYAHYENDYSLRLFGVQFIFDMSVFRDVTTDFTVHNTAS